MIERRHFTILVVEDSLADFLLIEQMLKEIKEFDKLIVHVENVAEAIDSLRKRQPDLVLLDLSLPDSTGLNTFLAVNKEAKSIPVLILTGLNDTRLALEAVKEGAQDYLVKGEFDERLLVKSILYSVERKNGLELWKTTQETYRLLFESNPIPMYIRERDSLRILKVNKACVALLGYSENEFRDMTIRDLYPVDAEDYELEFPMGTPDEEGFSKPQITRHVRKDGTQLLIECTIRELMFRGTPSYIVLADDITDRRRVQEEVLFQANVLKNVRDIVFVTDRKGTITYWNEGAEDAFGYRKSEIVGRTYDFLYPEIDKHKVPREQHNIIAGRLELWESGLVTKDGRILVCEIKASLLLGENDEILGVIRVCKDVTQNRRYAEHQKETVAMLNSIFHNVVQGIVLLDTSARIKAFNTTAIKQTIQLMGMELQENKAFPEYLTAEMHGEFNQYFEQALLNQRVHWEMAYRFSHSSIHWFGFSLSPVADDNGQVLGVCVSMINITERKLADEKFRHQFLEIENANKELDRLIKILSHDLRAPMNSISGLIALARNEQDPAEFASYLEMMDKSVKKLESFTQDIISSLKNRGSNAESEIQLHHLVQEIIDELKFVPGAENIRFVNDVPVALTLRTNGPDLRIILSNLISNAIKYHDDSKTDKFVRIGTVRHPVLLEVFVQDNGRGIAQEHHQKIFESYYTVQQREGSSGLGLSNVKASVNKLRGTIDLESEPGRGSTFRVNIPLS